MENFSSSRDRHPSFTTGAIQVLHNAMGDGGYTDQL